MYPGNFFIPRNSLFIRQTSPLFRGNLANGIGLLNRIKAFNWKGLINGASKTLKVVNQTIPLVKEAKPVVNNVRNVIKLAKAFGNETGNNKQKLSKKVSANYSDNNLVSRTKFDDNSYPTFFV